jgi:YegS/Rv2252/BmrU family lipid kinase
VGLFTIITVKFEGVNELRKILLIYNPVSGSAAFKRNLDEIIENFQRRKILLTIYRTRADSTAEEFAEIVRISGAEGVISAGGDGTLHTVINWLRKSSINLPVGIIGSGTSNDFATHLEIDTEKTFDAVAENKIRPIDLGIVNGREYFINVASAGVFTSIAHEVDVRQKNSIGKLAYYLRGLGELPNFKTVPLQILADGRNFELEAFLFLILNSPAVAGLKKITSSTKIDDGKLDFLALKQCSPRSLINLAQKILSGKFIEDDENIFYIQAETFEIKSPQNLIGDFDGEIGDTLPLKIQIVPHAINFFADK